MMNVGNQLTIVYLLFFLTDVIGHPDPALGVLVLTGIYAALVIVGAVLAGPWSDRVGKRRIFVTVSSVVIACSALTMALFPVWPGAVAGARCWGWASAPTLRWISPCSPRCCLRRRRGPRTWE